MRPRVSPDVEHTLGVLFALRVPPFVVQVVAWVFAAGLVAEHEEIDGVEYFSGDAAVTLAMRDRGFSVYEYEKKSAVTMHDILSDVGYAHALALLLRIRRGGLAWCLENAPNISHTALGLSF